MNRCIFISLAVLSCPVAAVLLLALLVRSGNDMTVFVNDVEGVDGAVCTWSGSQHFDVTLPAVSARFYILAFEQQGEITGLIEAKEAEGLQPESIDLQLVYMHADGNIEQIRLTPVGAPIIEHLPSGSVRLWFRRFQISKQLAELPEGSMNLIWKMEYRDANGEARNLSITVPLRKEEITVPSAIVKLNVDPHRYAATSRLFARSTRAYDAEYERRGIAGIERAQRARNVDEPEGRMPLLGLSSSAGSMYERVRSGRLARHWTTAAASIKSLRSEVR